MARALVAGGVRVLEVTLRTAAGLPAIEAIAREVPDAIIGAGTVRNAADAQAAQGRGRDVHRQPGLHAGGRIGLQGIGHRAAAGRVHRQRRSTMAADDGFTSQAVPGHGGRRHPAAQGVLGIFSDIAFCPTGGVTLKTASQFLALPNVKVVGGSWPRRPTR